MSVFFAEGVKSPYRISRTSELCNSGSELVLITHQISTPFGKALERLWEIMKEGLFSGESVLNALDTYRSTFRQLINVRRTPDFWIFFFDVIQHFEKVGCKNQDMIANLFDIMCEMSKAGIISCSKIEESMTKIFLSGALGPSLIISQLQKLLFLPYETAHHSIDSHFNVVMNTATSGNIGLLELLLKFGFTPLRLDDNAYDWLYIEKVLILLFDLEDFSHYSPLRLKSISVDTFGHISRHRFFLIMKSLEVLPKIRRQPHHTENYIHSLKLLFQSIPEPAITVNEVKFILDILCENAVSDDEKYSVISQFAVCFPESCLLHQPRTLEHLSRFQVRETLRAHKICLPHLVNSLLLPKCLKNYILLKETKLKSSPITFVRQENNMNWISDGRHMVYFIPDRS